MGRGPTTENQATIKNIMEASEEQKREEEDDKRRKKNLIIYKAPESIHQDGHKRKVEDKQLIETFRASVEMGNKTATSFVRQGQKNDEATTNRPLLVFFDNKKDVNEIIKNLNKLKDAEYKIKNLRIGPDRSLREREEVRRLKAKAEKLEWKGTRRLRAPCERVANNENEENPNRSLLIWYTNIDTLTQDKLHEIMWRMNQENCKPDVIALVEDKPKNSRAEWNPVWHKI